MPCPYNNDAMKKLVILIFFSLQALSIGIGSIPGGAKDPLSAALKLSFEPLTRPYLLFTGQWQNWNLFAPDPLRESLTFDIDFLQDEKKMASVPLAPESIPWMQRTYLLKIMRHLWNDGEMYPALRKEFLRSLCERWDLAEDMSLHLRVKFVDVIDPTLLNEEYDDVTVSCAPATS